MSEDEIVDGLETAFDILYIRKKVKQHWIFVLVFIAACITAFTFGIVLVKIFTVDTIVGSWGINFVQDFSTGTALKALLWIFLQEIGFILLPTLVFLVVICVVYWYVLIPEEEKTELKEWKNSKEKREKKHRKWKERHGEQFGGFSGLISIVMLIQIGIDGNWLVSFETLNLLYFLDIWITAIIWVVAVLGIPAAIIGFIVFMYKKW